MMMRTTPYDQITVFDLCDQADVRRATFYKHFKDKNDFFSYIISLIQEDIVESIRKDKARKKSPIEFYTVYVKKIVDYLSANSLIIDNVLKSEGFSVMMGLILDRTYSSLICDLTEDVAEGLTLPANISTVANFLNGGISQMIVAWISDRYCTEDELIADVRSIISKVLLK
jgi:AcrR family transcriptional regulator